MREYEQRYTPARLLGRRALLLLFFVVFLAALRGTWDVYWKERTTRQDRRQAEQSLTELKARESKLATKVAQLKTDQGVEAELREQYDVGKPGEQLIVLVDPTTDASSTGATQGRHWWSWLSHLW